MIRKLDALGRIVIPADIRKMMQIGEGDYLIFSVSFSFEELTLKKMKPFNLVRSINDLEEMTLIQVENLKWWEHDECDYVHDILEHLRVARTIANKLKTLE